MHSQLGFAVSAIRHLAHYAEMHDLSDADQILTDILAFLFGQQLQRC